MSAMRGTPVFKAIGNPRTGESSANLARAELEQKLVFKSGAKVDLGLPDPTRKIVHEGDVSRKSANKLDWLHIHLILLDNYLIMTKKRTDRGVEKLYVSKQVDSHYLPCADLAYSYRFVTIGKRHWRRSFEIYFCN